MSRDQPFGDEITTSDEFEDALQSLVESAVMEGVDVHGTWEFATRGSTHNWEIEIVELAKEFDDENV